MIAIMMDGFFDGADARIAVFPAGAAIFRRGAPADAVFRVRAGRVCLVRALEDGGEATMARAGPGETFAEAALFADVYHCDAIARTQCEIAIAPAGPIRARLRSDPGAAAELAAFLARQVRSLRARIELLRIKRAPERVLAWLSLNASGDPPAIARREAWAHVAGEIGLTPEALYRALRGLERAGRIRRGGRGEDVVLLPRREGRTRPEA
jgi:CRP-like cAMP-binding protein